MTARPCILVANHPVTYRDVLAGALADVYPSLHVLQLAPAELEPAIAVWDPLLIICSWAPETVSDPGCPTIVLYPEGRNEALLIIEGRSWTLAEPRLTDVLAAVDVALAPSESRPRLVASVLTETQAGNA